MQMHMSYRTFPKLPFPSTIRKLKSESFIRSLLPLLSNLEMAFVVFSSAALDPVPILALCRDRDGEKRKITENNMQKCHDENRECS